MINAQINALQISLKIEMTNSENKAQWNKLDKSKTLLGIECWRRTERAPRGPSVIHVTCPKIRIGQSRTMKVESAVFCMYSKFFFSRPCPAHLHPSEDTTADLQVERLFSARPSLRSTDRSCPLVDQGHGKNHQPTVSLFFSTAITNRQ